MLRFALSDEDYEILEARDGAEGFSAIGRDRPDLILLDWMLPGMSGIEFARRVKKDTANRDIPIIMLTARAEEDDKVKGLREGADDYITKPFSTRELKARIDAVMRRAGPSTQDTVQVGGLRLDPIGHQVTADGELIEMGPTEFRLLSFFMRHADRVYSRGQLLDNVWGRNVYVEERTVDVHIRRLRKALAAYGYDKQIQTVRTVGYRFSTQV